SICNYGRRKSRHKARVQRRIRRNINRNRSKQIDNNVGGFQRENRTAVEQHGEDQVNDNRQRFIYLCETYNLKISDGFCKSKDIHRFTKHEKSASVRTENNQPKDHTENLQVIEKPRYKFESFRNESIQNLYQRRLDEKLRDTEKCKFTEIYNNIIHSLKKATKEAIGIQEAKQSNNIWRNEEIGDSIDMKKKKYLTWLHSNQDKDLQEYKAAKNEVRRKEQSIETNPQKRI
ncbi:hypothetical protein HHI36_004414, partial [Cryptolaemus montrouzieri]